MVAAFVVVAVLRELGAVSSSGCRRSASDCSNISFCAPVAVAMVSSSAVCCTASLISLRSSGSGAAISFAIAVAVLHVRSVALAEEDSSLSVASSALCSLLVFKIGGRGVLSFTLRRRSGCLLLLLVVEVAAVT
jgi:hypothetical protein